MTDLTDKLHAATLGTDGEPLPDTSRVSVSVSDLRRALKAIKHFHELYDRGVIIDTKKPGRC